jgi:hypothetical protein
MGVKGVCAVFGHTEHAKKMSSLSARCNFLGIHAKKRSVPYLQDAISWAYMQKKRSVPYLQDAISWAYMQKKRSVPYLQDAISWAYMQKKMSSLSARCNFLGLYHFS